MNNCPVKILTVFWSPFVMEPKKFSNQFNGIEINLMETLARQAKFSSIYTTMDVPENWGTLHVANKSGSGLMGALLQKQGDIAIGNIAPNPERHLMFDFTVQYMQVLIHNFQIDKNVLQKYL